MTNALNAILLAGSLTINPTNLNQDTTQLNKDTNNIISTTQTYITSTLDPNLPPKEFQRQLELNIIYANGDYYIIEGDKDNGYKMRYTNIKNIPNDAVCKNYSGEPVFYVGNTEIKEIANLEEEKIGDDKFREFQNMPSCDTAGVKNLASN